MPVPASSASLLAPTDLALNESEALGLEAFQSMDRMREALAAQFTGGLSPQALARAFFDWSVHLAAAPGKRAELAYKAGRKAQRLLAHLGATALDAKAPACIEPLPGDDRFSGEGWQQFPYNIWSQAFLLNQQWWHNVTREVPGVAPHHDDVVSFTVRQLLDMASPSNNPLTNPDVIAKTRETGGANLVEGFNNWLQDVSRQATGQPPVGAEDFVVGRDVATTPGQVVYRNHLIELISTHPRPGRCGPSRS